MKDDHFYTNLRYQPYEDKITKMNKYKTIYFIYDADGGLWNEIKYWYKKNIL